MAQSLSINAGIANRTTGESLDIQGLAVTTTGDHHQAGRADVATSVTTITISADFANPGYAIFINRDDTNFVKMGTTSGDYGWRLAPGQIAVIPLDNSTSAVYLIADTATCQVQYLIYER